MTRNDTPATQSQLSDVIRLCAMLVVVASESERPAVDALAEKATFALVGDDVPASEIDRDLSALRPLVERAQERAVEPRTVVVASARLPKVTYRVPVGADGVPVACACPDHQKRGGACKHMQTVNGTGAPTGGAIPCVRPPRRVRKAA